MSPEDLGKKLLAEVEEVGLDEILNSLQVGGSTNGSRFDLPALDGLLQAITQARALPAKTPATAPIIELMSLLPGDGKTHLIYHLTAVAVLPKNLGGQQAAVIILDTDNRFSVQRLAHQIKRLAASKQAAEEGLPDLITQSLRHVHIFRPQSLSSTIATINSLQTYLFNPALLHSFDRTIAFIALDSASAYYWQNRTETEDAALLSSNTKSPPGYVQLAAALKNASRVFSTPIVFTTWYLGPPIKKTPNFGAADATSFRPSLPPPWQALATLRLVVRKAEVRKLPVEISVEEAVRESEIRQKVVEQGRFECFINEWGLEERVLRNLQDGRMTFEFFITGEGVKVSEEGTS